MKSSHARFLGGRPSGVACALALLLAGASNVACTSVGSISGSPGASGSGSSSGSASTTGTAGTGGVQVIMPGAPSSTSWYDTLKAADCSTAPTALPASRIWRLSALQWQNTVAQALGGSPPNVSNFPPDAVNANTGFSDDSTDDKITLPLAQAYFDTSEAVSTQAAVAAMTAFPCLATMPVAASCAQMVVTSYGTKLFRRATTPAEVTTYSNYFMSEAKLDPTVTAVGSMLKAMLMSPNFAYRTELGNSQPGTIDLTNDEIASMLSYTIADVPPDAQLASATLSDPATRVAQAERLAALPGAETKLVDFWRQYLALGTQPTAPEIALYSFNEPLTFFDKVAWQSMGAFKDLVTANYTYVDPTDTMNLLAQVYGSTKPDSTGKLMLDPTQRSGFLTSVGIPSRRRPRPRRRRPSFTVGFSCASACSARRRPRRRRTSCVTRIRSSRRGRTRRRCENYAKFSMDLPACNACHSFFQPLGLAFETYDGVGTYRTVDPGGMALDTTGTLDNAGDATGPYTNVMDMAGKLANSQIAQYCFYATVRRDSPSAARSASTRSPVRSRAWATT